MTMKKLFKNSISILVYVKWLDGKIGSIMQINTNIQIDTTVNNG